jgi:hypothetical protein
MNVPRRTFLQSGTLAVVSAGLAVNTGRVTIAHASRHLNDFYLPPSAEANAVLSFTRETFEPYIGDIFQAPNARGEMINLVLTQVRNYKVKDGTKLTTKTPRELRSFSLTFESKDRLPQFSSVHTVSHTALGKFDLFLNPHQREDGIHTYEAVFSHF